MSVTEPNAPRKRLSEPPTYDLEYLYDDRENPSEVTLFTPEGERVVTEWLTADVSAAVPLDEMR